MSDRPGSLFTKMSADIEESARETEAAARRVRRKLSRIPPPPKPPSPEQLALSAYWRERRERLLAFLRKLLRRK